MGGRMIFKIESSTFTLEQILYHISKGRSNHLKLLIVDKFAELEAQLKQQTARADKAEALLKDKQ